MTISDDALTTISGWTEDDLSAGDDVRAAGALYAGAALEQLSLIELVERLNELNQNKMVSIGAGEASNLLHEFWDKGYKRMPARRRKAVFARVFGAPAGEATDPAASNDEFSGLWQTLVDELAEGSSETVAPAAGALRDNLAEHTDDATTKAAVELQTAYGEIAALLSDMELRAAYGRADDMWQVIERIMEDFGGGPDVQRAQTLATSGATILRRLPELCADGHADAQLVETAKTWLAADKSAA